MARVIKADPQEKPADQPRRSGQKRAVIAKEVYGAQQKASEIEQAYRAKREEILAEGRQLAAQAREEAQTTGAEEAFSQAAYEALAAFRARALRYGEANDDIQALALEVVRKIFGSPSKLGERAIRKIFAEGLFALRARRKLRVQVPAQRLAALVEERPVLIRALGKEPDLVIEGVGDVSPGFARVVTEVGGALCTEQSALDQLAQSIDVDETAVAPRPRSAVHRDVDLDSQETADIDLKHEGAYQSEDISDELEDFGDFADEETESHAPKPKRRKISVKGGLQPLDLDEEPDPERTMALDVSKLRDELSAAEDDDDLDLYTDESLPD